MQNSKTNKFIYNSKIKNNRPADLNLKITNNSNLKFKTL